MAALGEAGAPLVVLKSLQECPISHVTVYRNQAEIHRLITLSSEEVEAGNHDIVVQGLAREVDSNTLRVKGLGAFEILEVTMEASYPEQDEKPRANELKQEIKEVRAQLRGAEQNVSTLQKAKAHAEQYVANFVASAAQDPSKNHTASNMEPEAVSVEAMVRVMDFYRSQQEQFDDQLFKEQENLAQLNERLNRLLNELRQISHPGGVSGVQVRNDATISINVTQPNTYLELTLSYILPNASWTPSYDMRLSSGDQMMTLTYYGQVRQQTGEDWSGCTLSLSTAEPAIQGFPPTLNSKTVSSTSSSSYYGESLDATSNFGLSASIAMAAPPGAAGPMMRRRTEAAVVSTTVAKQDAVGASLFEIPRKVFIDSDGKSHKVTIANLQMQAQLTHFASPAVSSHAYIQAKAANPSDYSLLKSSNMNVYLDGSFITKTELPENVSPGESFTTFVGVDPTVKLEYRPVKTRERTSGWMTKTATMSYEYATLIRNTKTSDINIFVTDSVPRSEAERVTVELTAPATTELTPLTTALGTDEVPSLTDKQVIQQLIERGATNTTVQNTVTNNIIWARSVTAGGSITLPMHYHISRPTDVQVDIESRT